MRICFAVPLHNAKYPNSIMPNCQSSKNQDIKKNPKWPFCLERTHFVVLIFKMTKMISWKTNYNMQIRPSNHYTSLV
jgi:hypothetical protein